MTLCLPCTYTVMAADIESQDEDIDSYINEEESVSDSSQSNENVDDSATNGAYDYTKDEEYTQSFYMPKSSFHSDADYKRYCQNMYNMGYMNSDYEWTSDAQNFINNSTGDNMKTLSQNARNIVEDRIKSGEMSYEDSPYLTYDEKQKITSGKATYDEVLSDRNTTGNNEESSDTKNSEEPTETPVVTNEPEDEEAFTNEAETPTVTPEEQEPEEQLEGSSFGIFRTVIMVALVLFIAIGSYFIYKKQS